MIKIKVYSAPFCGYCQMAKDFFDRNGLPYEEVDVSLDQQAAEDMVSRTKQMGVPVIEIGDDILIGFNQGEIKQSLSKAGIKIED